ncbi:MAG: hypothetical protein C0621_02485 [Desulfuromonas sp.]|nr:MAG: hypothetical protein C0621_02485 [Desulfuromonas sp.]
MSLLTVALVGAETLLGEEIRRTLEANDNLALTLRLFAASKESEPDEDDTLLLEPLTEEALNTVDLAVFAAPEDIVRRFIPLATAAGAVCLDTGNVGRDDASLPLAPLQPGAPLPTLSLLPTATQLMLARVLRPLQELAPLQRLVVSTFEAVSTYGEEGIDALRREAGELLNGRPAPATLFSRQLAFNCIQNSVCEESWCEGMRQILGSPSLGIAFTQVQAPLFYGHAIALQVEFAAPITLAATSAALAACEGVGIADDVATPADAMGSDDVLIAAPKIDASVEHGLSLWLVADNLRLEAEAVVSLIIAATEQNTSA